MPILSKLSELDLEFPLEELFGVLGIVAEDLIHSEELGFVVLNHAAVGGDGYLAAGACV